MEKEKHTDVYQDKDGHLTSLGLSLYADYLSGVLAELPKGIKSHVEQCSYCRHELMMITDLMEDIDHVEENRELYSPIKTTKPLLVRRMNPHVKAIAGLVAVLAIAWLIQQFMIGTFVNSLEGVDDQEVTVESVLPVLDTLSPDPIVLPKPENQIEVDEVGEDVALSTPGAMIEDNSYAMSFKANAIYESLAMGEFRLSNNPLIQYPALDSVFLIGEKMKFSWLSTAEGPISLDIVDYRGQTVKTISSESVSPLEWQIDLPEGLYYWKFICDEQLLKAGRFYIRRP
ncbi:MAG: hypothetical protein M0P69_02910 [Bacteroidales bacterium]|jgi:hypothetical protein|nr:hypothetical protein [Bacteroidales bacterium]MDD3385740.1 hypothetical protein [Bacteroidales bacterium]MDD3811661.1 hypothetical protein [Bacteroidales bacterium]MDD4813190.1 hypothetical protein [Bacteroidales bacterium]NLO67918.1 hypothetical protein [Bacteroidales bacterium]